MPRERCADPLIGDPNALGQALGLWHNRYPGHPAGEAIVPMLIDDSRIAWAPARKVALLLPLNGPLRPVGQER